MTFGIKDVNQVWKFLKIKLTIDVIEKRSWYLDTISNAKG